MKEFVPSEPTILLTNTDLEVAVLLPEVGIEDQVVQTRAESESDTKAGRLERKAHEDRAWCEAISACRWCERFVSGEKGHGRIN